MKIIMLKTIKDSGLTIWRKGDIIDTEDGGDYYVIKEIDGVTYAVSKSDKNISFLEVKE